MSDLFVKFKWGQLVVAVSLSQETKHTHTPPHYTFDTHHMNRRLAGHTAVRLLGAPNHVVTYCPMHVIGSCRSTGATYSASTPTTSCAV